MNDGFYRALEIDAPEGTVVNCRWPAPVVGGWETQTRLVDVIFRALLPALPERLPAGTKAMMCQAGFGSLDEAAGTYICFYDTFAGGYGARLRATARTQSRRTGRTPRTHRSRRRSSTTRSGSTGSRSSRTRRGPAASAAASACARTTASTCTRPSRSSPTATGAARGASLGGRDGRVAEYVHIRDGAETRLSSKTTLDLVPGDVISVRTCGGGGYGPPEERDPERVLRDVLEGKVSAERAREIYRVAVDGGRLDEAATARLREAV